LLTESCGAEHTRLAEGEHRSDHKSEEEEESQRQEEYLPILVSNAHGTLLLMTCNVSVACPSEDAAWIEICCIPWSEQFDVNLTAYPPGTGCPSQFQYFTPWIVTEKPAGTDRPAREYAPEPAQFA
jgi:hypothetical protein